MAHILHLGKKRDFEICGAKGTLDLKRRDSLFSIGVNFFSLKIAIIKKFVCFETI